MGLLSWIGKGLQSFLTPQSFKTGERFEDYVRKKLFSGRYYELLQRTYGYNVRAKKYVSSSNPDFKFRDRQTSRIFYAEAKYRKSFFKGKISWCTEQQFRRYHQNNHVSPVLIILGVGGLPNKPESAFLIPLKKIRFTELYLSEIEKYKIHPRRVVTSRTLWRG